MYLKFVAVMNLDEEEDDSDNKDAWFSITNLMVVIEALTTNHNN